MSLQRTFITSEDLFWIAGLRRPARVDKCSTLSASCTGKRFRSAKPYTEQLCSRAQRLGTCSAAKPVKKCFQLPRCFTRAREDCRYEYMGNPGLLALFLRLWAASDRTKSSMQIAWESSRLCTMTDRRLAEEQRHEVKRLQRLGNVEAVEGDTGSQWSAAPASADLSAPDQGVAGVMVAAVGSLQESGFAARRAASRLKEMQTSTYLEAARRMGLGLRAKGFAWL
eukprot:s1204_g4.t1